MNIPQAAILGALITSAALTPYSYAQQDSSTGRRTAIPPGGQNSDPGSLAPRPADDGGFLAGAAAAGREEIKLAALAADRAADPRVREAAEMLIAEHTAAGKDIARVAGSLKVELPDKPSEAARTKLEELTRLEGKEFDRAFLAEMIHCHLRDIAWYEAGSKTASSAEVLALIDRTIPRLKAHADKLKVLSQPDEPPRNKGTEGSAPGEPAPPPQGVIPGN